MTEHQYLLIVGTPKSATTSLFRYLADHPDVCCANRKETYFFARELGWFILGGQLGLHFCKEKRCLYFLL
ncbi:sulfotransferase [Chloroflexi bacterium TSY]|nr:sulfotransferase [Chloroflexi bacterium TSY]